MKKRFEERIKDAGNAFRPEPNLQWSDIESRLNNRKGSKRVSLSRWLGVAASLAILIISLFIFLPQSMNEPENDLFTQSSAISDLHDMPPDQRSGTTYSVSELYFAYHEAGLLPSRH